MKRSELKAIIKEELLNEEQTINWKAIENSYIGFLKGALKYLAVAIKKEDAKKSHMIVRQIISKLSNAEESFEAKDW